MIVFISTLVAGILTDNIVLSGLFGIDDTIKPEASIKDVVKRCGLLGALLFLSSAVYYPLVTWVLKPLGLDCLATLLCILVIFGLSFGAFTLFERFLPVVYKVIAPYRGLMSCSVVILGGCLSLFSSEAVTGYLTALLYSLALVLGFLLVSVIFWGIRDLLKGDSVPASVKGLPLSLIVAALLSMAFECF